MENYNPENTHIELINYVKLLKYKQEVVVDHQKQISVLKNEIRDLMKDLDITEFIDEQNKVNIKLSYPKTFDIGMFKLKQPGFAAAFITQETKVVTKDILSTKQKNRLIKNYPKEYNEYLIDLTPRLVIK